MGISKASSLWIPRSDLNWFLALKSWHRPVKSTPGISRQSSWDASITLSIALVLLLLFLQFALAVSYSLLSACSKPRSHSNCQVVSTHPNYYWFLLKFNSNTCWPCSVLIEPDDHFNVLSPQLQNLQVSQARKKKQKGYSSSLKFHFHLFSLELPRLNLKANKKFDLHDTNFINFIDPLDGIAFS